MNRYYFPTGFQLVAGICPSLHHALTFRQVLAPGIDCHSAIGFFVVLAGAPSLLHSSSAH